MFYMLLFSWACTGSKEQMIFFIMSWYIKAYFFFFLFFFTMTQNYKMIENQAKISLSFSCGPLE